jgi:AcrR family transcriptional regulator
MATADTKTTILDAAEALFAAVGFAAATLRQLTARAGVNLAAVHYHFGSKDELAVAVLARRLHPINAQRHARLDALPARPDVGSIVRAFVEPVLLAGVADGAPAGPPAAFCRLFGRIMVEQPPFLRAFLAGQFRELGWRFAAVLGEALPHHEPATLWWRLHFLVGAMAHTLQNASALAHLTDGLCRDDDPRLVVEQLVAFAAAGFAAPRVRTRTASRKRTGARRREVSR